MRDAHLADKLDTPEALSWLFTWGIIGLKRLLRRGQYSETDSTKEVMQRWVTKTASLHAFVFRGGLEQTKGQRVSKELRYKKYEAFCEENHWAPVSKNRVTRRLPTLVATREIRGSDDKRYWIDLAVRGVEAHLLDGGMEQATDDRERTIYRWEREDAV